VLLVLGPFRTPVWSAGWIFRGRKRGRLPALANNAKHKTHFTVASDTIGVNLNCLMFEQEKATKQKQQQQLMS